ncbi:super-infection exclusion protein B [Aliarcobacter skirrowii]|uniref:super-infection exclusion protein B n=1 Tax=Aliarcobacter skirrowii TaxID=28200 RepID=UPI000D61E922|nr:super-infection exclusion protein B [Aliarcobacter skirrowii]PWE22556.1 hypothetical protein DGF29_00440 [Aliarcobacter skirrowii]PWE26291.1 hypothetical protein DGE88_01400 [Aliarcobacter skirrowii]RJO56796.1 hypothetical protein DIR39_02575 [Aliarcobacter skirrowii]RJO58750.1 hypothetical protein DIR38_02575 [Aliarcobacter skirrowii]
MDISGIINFLKLSTKFIVLICIISGLLLFSNQEFIEQLSLFDFKEEFGIYLGITFLFTLVLSIINIFLYLWKLTKTYVDSKKVLAEKKIEEEKIEKQRIEEEKQRIEEEKQRIEEEKQRIEEENELYQRNLENLDYKELSVIREFFYQELNTIEMSIDDSAVLGLEQKCIIEKVSNRGYRGDITGDIRYFRISSSAQHYFESYNFQNININRPEWIFKIQQQKNIIQQQNEFIETQNLLKQEMTKLTKDYLGKN